MKDTFEETKRECKKKNKNHTLTHTKKRNKQKTKSDISTIDSLEFKQAQVTMLFGSFSLDVTPGKKKRTFRAFSQP